MQFYSFKQGTKHLIYEYVPFTQGLKFSCFFLKFSFKSKIAARFLDNSLTTTRGCHLLFSA